MNNITICNLKREEDLLKLADEYANYYNNSVSWEENWTTTTASDMFKFFIIKNLIYFLLHMIVINQ